MTRRGVCLHSGAGKETLPALDDPAAIQGLSFCPRPAGVPRRPLALVVGLVLLGIALGLAACGGDGGEGSATATPTGTPLADLTGGELRDSTGSVVAKPVSQETLEPEEFLARVEEDSAWSDHLDLARDLGYTDVQTALTVEYDNGAVVTSGLIASQGIDRVILVSATEPLQSVFIMKPTLVDGRVTSIEIITHRGVTTLDLETRTVTAQDMYSSCSYGNCLAGALYFWVDDDEFWSLYGFICDGCWSSQSAIGAVVCTACLATYPAIALASAAYCAIEDACDFCINDNCGQDEHGEPFCAAGGYGPTGSAVVRTVADYSCVNPKTQNSQCELTSTIQILEECEYGCAPPPTGDTASRSCVLNRACSTDADCPADRNVGDEYCATLITNGAWNASIVQPYRDYFCSAGTCTSAVRYRGTSCPYGCAPGGAACFDPATCERDETVQGNCVVGQGGDQGDMLYETYKHYYATETNSGWICTSETRYREIECLYGCEAGFLNSKCFDPAACDREEVTGRNCVPALGEGWQGDILYETYKHYYPTQNSNETWTCASETLTRQSDCQHGCDASRSKCFDPAACDREEVTGSNCVIAQGEGWQGDILYETYKHYYPSQNSDETWTCASETLTRQIGCDYGCSTDGKSCAEPLPSCVSATCEREEPLTDPICQLRPDDNKYIIAQDFRHYFCESLTTGGSTCTSEVITRAIQECPHGCALGGQSCAQPPPTCDPAACEREEPATEPVCAQAQSGWIIEQIFRQYFCRSLNTGGSTCDSTTVARTLANCPYGCASDGKSCAQPPPGTVPAAPSGFLALQHSGGTEFEWTDNSDNEDGFRVYFGSRSLGGPSQLITTVGPDTQLVDTDFVRSGSETCWEVYAYNAAGESAPAWYCLPP